MDRLASQQFMQRSQHAPFRHSIGKALALLVAVLVIHGCDRPTSMPRPVTAPPRNPRIKTLAFEQFHLATAFMWDGPSECRSLDDVAWSHDSRMRYSLVLGTPVNQTQGAGIVLQYDENKQLISYSEQRSSSARVGPRPWQTSWVFLSTGRGKESWERLAFAENTYFVGGKLTPSSLVVERSAAPAESVWASPTLGPPSRLLRLTLEKCRAGASFERDLPPAASLR